MNQIYAGFWPAPEWQYFILALSDIPSSIRNVITGIHQRITGFWPPRLCQNVILRSKATVDSESKGSVSMCLKTDPSSSLRSELEWHFWDIVT